VTAAPLPYALASTEYIVGWKGLVASTRASGAGPRMLTSTGPPDPNNGPNRCPTFPMWLISAASLAYFSISKHLAPSASRNHEY
jgi:hypothetical protein